MCRINKIKATACTKYIIHAYFNDLHISLKTIYSWRWSTHNALFNHLGLQSMSYNGSVLHKPWCSIRYDSCSSIISHQTCLKRWPNCWSNINSMYSRPDAAHNSCMRTNTKSRSSRRINNHLWHIWRNNLSLVQIPLLHFASQQTLD